MSPPRDLEAWMWAEACEALTRAERLHREFFRLGPPSRQPSWEPPIDIIETERELWIIAALLYAAGAATFRRGELMARLS